MKFNNKSTSPLTDKTECLVVFVNSKKQLPGVTAAVNKALGGSISQAIKAGDLGNKQGNHTLLLNVQGIAAKRVLLVYSDSVAHSDRAFIELADSIAQSCLKGRFKSASLCLGDLCVENRDAAWLSRKLTEAFIYHNYRFDAFKSKQAKADPSALGSVTYLAADKRILNSYKKGAATGEAIGNGASLARDLGNTPPNICNPSYLAKQAKSMARSDARLTVKVYGEKEMDRMGMHSLLSVGRGSAQPSQLIVMEYKGGKKSAAPYALVGKGITFDSGGISLKPGAGMDEMKFDMCGAASVFGALRTVLDLQLPINLVCVVAAAENMPSDIASRPGDIVTSMAGKTIEILNTDAEGRLVLCDALTFVQKYKPKTIIDLATLTGAIITSLGRQASGLFSNDEDLAQTLIEAGQQSGDRVWQFPIWEEYTKQLTSPFADLANIGGAEAGSITAACFLAEFTKDTTWAHLDICGVAWQRGEKKGATGRPVGLLAEYLMKG